jgi:hypothetical protein
LEELAGELPTKEKLLFQVLKLSTKSAIYQIILNYGGLIP